MNVSYCFLISQWQIAQWLSSRGLISSRLKIRQPHLHLAICWQLQQEESSSGHRYAQTARKSTCNKGRCSGKYKCLLIHIACTHAQHDTGYRHKAVVCPQHSCSEPRSSIAVVLIGAKPGRIKRFSTFQLYLYRLSSAKSFLDFLESLISSHACFCPAILMCACWRKLKLGLTSKSLSIGVLCNADVRQSWTFPEVFCLHLWLLESLQRLVSRGHQLPG